MGLLPRPPRRAAHWRQTINPRTLLILGLPLAALSAEAAQTLTCDLAPYDLLRANWTAANYLQALINPKWEAVAFAQDTFGAPDASGGLYFIDDQGRVIWAFCNEAEFGPVARVEAVATLARGILRARIPGSKGRYFFAIEGREGLYLKPDGQSLGAYWVQDTSTGFCHAQVRVADPGSDDWREPTWSPTPESLDAAEPETIWRGTVAAAAGDGKGEATVTSHSFRAAHDRAPIIRIRSPKPARIQVTLSAFGETHFIRSATDRRRIEDGEHPCLPAGTPDTPVGRFLLLEHEAHLATSDKTGWDDPRLWGQLNSMLLVAFDTPPDRAVTLADKGACRELTLTWDAAREVTLRLGTFMELDPDDVAFPLTAADHVARDGRFGCRPYFPTRTSNGFVAGPLGLAAAAWLLTEYNHPDAARVKTAALEAFGSIVDAESRGYFGERTGQAIITAYYLKRVAPDAFDYDRWVRHWADREVKRCPPGWRTPPWSDTALRMIVALRYATLVTGDGHYKELRQSAMQDFALPAEDPVEAFLWHDKPNVFDGYDCTGSAMLLGEWGADADPRAEAMVRRAGPRYFCDFGFAPYRTWTCDDLLPYYVGYSLPAVYKGREFAPRVLGLEEYASYDAEGKVTVMGRPEMERP